MVNQPVTLDSVRGLITAAVEDEAGDAWSAAVKVQSRLSDNPEFRAEVADALVNFAIERLAAEAGSDLNANLYHLPDGTPW